MSRKKVFRNIRYYFQYFPFTVNTFLLVFLGFFSYKILYKPLPEETEDPAPFLPFILLMAKMALGFILVLIAVSAFSAVLSWLYFLWLKRKNKTGLEISFTNESVKGKKNRLFLNAVLPGVRRPLLGFIKGRLFYDRQEMTGKFSLLSNQRESGSLFRFAIKGKSRIQLPDIKEYELRGAFIYFEDMLHLFSLAVAQPLSGQFYQPPVLKTEEDAEIAPKRTENMDIRIEQMRRVEGEYLNYKDFEAGDDVRRIVWKVYAKNRELVVRIPEMFEPYASHLYFYASFFTNVKSSLLKDGYFREMLNYYKNNIWTVYDTLSRKEWEMRYIPDLNFSIPEHLNSGEKTARIISSSSWHQELSLSHYFNARHGSVLCISSLADPEELEQTLEQCDGSTVVYFIKCSRVFRHFIAWSWLRRMIFLPPKDRLNRVRTRWVFSPTRFQIQKREKRIENALQKSAVRWTEL